MQSDVAHLALVQFRKDWPFMAKQFEALRVKAQRESEGGEADPRCAGCTRTPSPRPVTRGESFHHNTKNASQTNCAGLNVETWGYSV